MADQSTTDGIATQIGDNDGGAFTITNSVEDLLIDGKYIGETAGECFLAVFKSEDVDTWYFGNMVMKNYYSVFDATAADENKEDYIVFGIAEKVTDNSFTYQSGSVENIFYDADGKEITGTVDVDENDTGLNLTDEQLDDLQTVIGVILYALFNAAAIAVGAYFVFEFKEIYKSLNQNTDQYYALGDFGYYSSEWVNPIETIQIIMMPYIWDQIKWQVIISTVIYAVASIAGFFVFLPLDILSTSVYLHYLIYLMNTIVIESNSNIVEIVQLEQQIELIYSYLLALDFALAGSALTIGFITAIILFVDHVNSE